MPARPRGRRSPAPRAHLATALLGASLLTAACSGTVDDGGEPSPDPGKPRESEVAPATAIVAPPVTASIALPSAPAMVGDVRYLPGRDSALVYLPVVDGVQDYRVYALTPGVSVRTVGGGAQVDGATLYCAGLRQHNQCDDAEALDFGPSFRVPGCDGHSNVHVPKEVLRVVQVDGLTAASDVVVEAIDALCPFPGAEGVRHTDLTCVNDGVTTAPATVGDRVVTWKTCPTTFPIRTEAEIRADYGSLIVNGHGPVPRKAGQSPFESIGLPAPNRPPVVLARAVVRLTPLGTRALPPGFTAEDFFEDFDDPSDQPRRVIENGAGTLVPRDTLVAGTQLFQSSTLDFYNHSSDDSQVYVARGTLRSVFADGGQDIMASNVMVPRRAFALPASDDAYVHVTFDVPTDATQRRYWTFFACGAEEKGKTIGTGPAFAADGALAARQGVFYGPGFMDPTGSHISAGGWNCLQLVPRNGSYYAQPGGPYPRAETDLRVLVNAHLPDYDVVSQHDSRRSVAIQSPDMEQDKPAEQGTWYRHWNGQHQRDGVLFDDEMYIEQRTHIDVFFNRGRVVLYANGVQKVCNGLGKSRLTMAEAAIGIGHLLYHSSAERTGFLREDLVHTAQYQYRKNLPFIDQRGFDNVGVRENAALPADFKADECYAGN